MRKRLRDNLSKEDEFLQAYAELMKTFKDITDSAQVSQEKEKGNERND